MDRDDFEAPIMPTGSGVADLEIAREQDALAAERATPAELAPTDERTAASQVESEAHPS